MKSNDVANSPDQFPPGDPFSKVVELIEKSIKVLDFLSSRVRDLESNLDMANDMSARLEKRIKALEVNNKTNQKVKKKVKK